VKRLVRRLLKSVIALFVLVTMRLEIQGQQHIPARGPTIVIGNHFSWFEVVVMLHVLPTLPAMFAATELQRFAFIRLIMRVMTLIPVWRGRMDRAALQDALGVLAEGQVLGIFPEGGIDPAVQAAVRRGERIESSEGHLVRDPAVLIEAPSGAAWLADRSRAPILPIAFMGTEDLLTNLRRLRRTDVQVRIGPVFGPFAVPAGARGQARRKALADLTQLLMWQIARLMPAERRGPYQSLPPGPEANA
jgi:1-acyl-sn-glycerol-3-phosphate acyltransferase